jgi:hypothetical protein
MRRLVRAPISLVVCDICNRAVGTALAGLSRETQMALHSVVVGAKNFSPLVCPTWVDSIKLKELDGGGDDNRSQTARRSREARLKEAEGKPTTAGTRTDREAWHMGRAC